MKKILFFIPLLFIGGCAGVNQQLYSNKVATWVGHNVSELVTSWGYPSKTLVGPSGNLVYAYERMAQETLPSYNLPPLPSGASFTIPGETYIDYCRTFFEIAPSKKIVTWRWEGNGCQ